MTVPPRFHCETCQDWGTVVPPSGQGLVPCPGDELTGAPCTAPPPHSTTLQEEPT